MLAWEAMKLSLAKLSCWTLGALALLAPAASATWSIIAVNTKTGEVCIASATCIEGFPLITATPVLRVGLGGACAQSLVDQTGFFRQTIHNDLIAGSTPQQILDHLEALDLHHQQKQYGIVNMSDDPVTFSGSSDGWAYYGVARQMGDIKYAIQGNVLTGIQVVTAAENALLMTPGDLGQKVMAAMEGARVYGGDGRCSCDFSPTYCGCPPPSFTYSSFTAFFALARIGDVDGATCDATNGCATGQYFSTLASIPDPNGGPDPVIDLTAQYAVWRASKAGLTDQLKTRVVAPAQRIRADGASLITIEVELRDLDGLLVPGASSTLSIVDVSGIPAVAAVGAVTPVGPGRFQFPLTSTGALGEGRWRITVQDPSGDVLLWPELAVRAEAPAELFASHYQLSASQGGTVSFSIDCGPADSSAVYLLLASASGTSPGTPFSGLVFPLRLDRIMRLSYVQTNSSRFQDTVGFLDMNGRATARFVAPPNLLYDYVGRRFDWSAGVFGPPDHATPPTGFDIVP